jgi:hypothetical protein
MFSNDDPEARLSRVFRHISYELQEEPEYAFRETGGLDWSSEALFGRQLRPQSFSVLHFIISGSIRGIIVRCIAHS